MFCSSFPVPWHDCAIQGETIDSTSDVADASKVNYDSPNKETCSDDCHKDASCAFWTYHEQAKLCTWKTAEDNKVPNDNVWHGSENCSGIGKGEQVPKDVPSNYYAFVSVDEAQPAGTDPIHGDWSPWSAFVTPCIKKKTGSKVLKTIISPSLQFPYIQFCCYKLKCLNLNFLPLLGVLRRRRDAPAPQLHQP